MRIYSVYDKKALEYSPVMSFPSDIIAIRAIEMDLSKGISVPANYPHDFCLCCLGELDERSGELKPLSPIEVVYELATYKFAKD